MALAERFRIATKPAFFRGRMLEFGRLVFVVIGLAAITVVVLRIFVLGYPILALWLAAAFCAWVFIFGAARASETPRRPLRHSGR
jgi:hypothetical protein